MPPTNRSASGWMTFLGVLHLIAGVVVLLTPVMAGELTATFLGIMLVFAGIVSILTAARPGAGGATPAGPAQGAVSLVVGLVLWFWPGVGLAAVALTVGSFLLLAGILRVVWGLRRRPDAGWLWPVCTGAATLLLGIVILTRGAAAGAVLVGIVVGIHFIVSGLSLTVIGRAIAPRNPTR